MYTRLRNAGISGLCHHTQFTGGNQDFLNTRQTLPTEPHPHTLLSGLYWQNHELQVRW